MLNPCNESNNCSSENFMFKFTLALESYHVGETFDSSTLLVHSHTEVMWLTDESICQSRCQALSLRKKDEGNSSVPDKDFKCGDRFNTWLVSYNFLQYIVVHSFFDNF